MLNKEQQEAVNAPLGHNLVIASAGTGKTSTIVARIERLIESGTDPKKILLLTFTNKAAREMVSRLEKKFGTLDIEAGTFHAVSYRWLKKIEPNLTLKQPKELKLLFKTIYDKRDFARAGFETAPYQSSTLFDMFGFYQNSEFSLGFAKWVEKNYPEHRELASVYEDIALEYEELKKSYGYLSFNDLLLEVIKNREKIERFTEVLVDEYQDTNNLQGLFLDSLNYESLFCVGDYDQSIYAFNGANIEIIAGFAKRYEDARIYTLTKNYRSTRYILDLANRVIEKNERIYPKRLEVENKKEPVLPKLLEYHDLYAQYEGIAARIAASSTPKEEIAVIFRNNSSADGIEAALRQAGIGCKRRGGVSFFDIKEIKLFFDLLSFMLNPKDMIAFIHIMEYAKGIGSNIAKELYEAAFKCGDGDIKKGFIEPVDINPYSKGSRNVQLALFDDFVQLGSKARFKEVVGEGFLSSALLLHPKLSEEGAWFLENLRNLFVESGRIKRAKTMATHLLQSPLYRTILEKIAQNRAKLKDGTIDEGLLENARQSMERRTRLVSQLAGNYGDVYRFYNAMVLGSGELEQGSGVNLLTVHAAKGLEFKEVYVIDLMEGRFPNLRLVSKGGSIEEERRLFYVAVTRAKELLYLSFAKYDRVKKEEFEPSRFLSEAGMVAG